MNDNIDIDREEDGTENLDLKVEDESQFVNVPSKRKANISRTQLKLGVVQNSVSVRSSDSSSDESEFCEEDSDIYLDLDQSACQNQQLTGNRTSTTTG